MRDEIKHVSFDVDQTVVDTQDGIISPTPGINNLTSKLKEKGIGYSVITNNEKWFQVNTLNFVGCHDLASADKFYCSYDSAVEVIRNGAMPSYFEGTGCPVNDEIMIEQHYTQKPSPFMFEKLLKETGLSPEKIMYVGNDLAADVIPAKKLGMKVWYVEGTGTKEEQEQAKSLADYHSTREELSSGIEKLVESQSLVDTF